MDAWEILYDNSTLTTGDAWEHLNNQEGGGEGDIIIVGGITEMDIDLTLSANIDTVLSLNVNDPVLTLDLEDSMSTNINDELTVDI